MKSEIIRIICENISESDMEKVCKFAVERFPQYDIYLNDSLIHRSEKLYT